MTQIASVAQVRAATMPELLATLSTLTGKNVARFADRASGERRVIAALKLNGTLTPAEADAAAASAPAKKTKVVKKEKAKSEPKPRRIKGAAGAERTGRPPVEFRVRVRAAGGATKQQEGSLRDQLLKWLDKRENKEALISEINKHFDRQMNGVVDKLIGQEWLLRMKPAE